MDQAIRVVSVETQPEYVVGLPIHVAITIQANPNTSSNEMIFADIFGLNESIGIEVFQVGSDRLLARYSPTPVLEPEMGVYGDDLAAGNSHRMLVDISPLLNPLNHPGHYSLRLWYVTPDEEYPAEPVELRLRAATSEETTMIAALAGDRGQYPNWIAWTLSKPENDQLPDMISPDNPLRFNLLLRKLIYGNEELRGIDPLVFRILDGVYRPEASALVAEAQLARGDESAYQQMKTETLKTAPGLAWWFQILDEGGGYIGPHRFPVRP